MSAEWKERKKLKDSDLEVAFDAKISELRKLNVKKKVQSMAIWSKFFSGIANKKHSDGGSSQDMHEEEADIISAPADNVSQSSSFSSDPTTESSQAASTSGEKARPTPKQDDLRKKIQTEKTLFLVSTRNANMVCCRCWIAMSSKKER